MENWEKVGAVRRMQDCIEKNINAPVSLRMLADAAGYSPWHAARVFKEMTGLAPFQYLRAVRLARAATALTDPGRHVVDVALDFLFESHEGFTRAFSQHFGMSPRQYARQRPPPHPWLPPSLRNYYLELQRGERKMTSNAATNTVFVQVIDRPARKFVLKRGNKATDYFEYCEETGCDTIWHQLEEIKEALGEPIGVWLPENLRRPGTSLYAHGVEVPINFSGKVPEDFEVIDLKPCKMMVFQGPPFDDSRFMEAIKDVWQVMNTYNPELYGFAWADEDGPRFQMVPQGYRGYIEGRPVRELNTSKSIRRP